MESFNAGQFVNQGTYSSFQPNSINRHWNLKDMELLDMLGHADRLIGKLDMYSKYIPNIDLFIEMHVTTEATLSSKIEGTRTNIDDAIFEKSRVAEHKRDDWQEVQNYMTALNAAIKQLNTLPFSSRLIRDTHKSLLQGVRGEMKLPGEFRTSQNWIGGVNINDATFVPPIHSDVHTYMSDIEHFVHNSSVHFPELLKIALIHYQFETIHPFLDGNGRIGRLMIPLYLMEKNILHQPILYLSKFLEKNRMLYYDALMRVRLQNDITSWFKFFLRGIIETTESGIETFDKILQLEKSVKQKALSFGSRAENALAIIIALFKKPVIDAKKVALITGLSMPSVYTLLDDLEKAQIIQEATGAKRNKLYIFDDYIELFR
ncbi:MAG: Fic family protein [Crocinitomicaceae bacterium]